MFDKLIDIVVQFVEEFKPYEIVREYDGAIRLRCGKSMGKLQSGKLHWRIPFIDEIIQHSQVWSTENLPVQSLTTKDGKPVVVKGVIKYRVKDIEHFLLEVFNATDAISDMTCGIISEYVEKSTWEELSTENSQKEITKKTKKEAEKWGLEVATVTLTDKGQIRSIRLFNEHDHVM